MLILSNDHNISIIIRISIKLSLKDEFFLRKKVKYDIAFCTDSKHEESFRSY